MSEGTFLEIIAKNKDSIPRTVSVMTSDGEEICKLEIPSVRYKIPWKEAFVSTYRRYRIEYKFNEGDRLRLEGTTEDGDLIVSDARYLEELGDTPLNILHATPLNPSFRGLRSSQSRDEEMRL